MFSGSRAKAITKSKYSFKGNQTGNYQVIGGGRFVLMP